MKTALLVLFAILYPTISVLNLFSDYKTMKSNNDLMKEIHKSNNLFDSLLEEVQANKKLTEAVQHKATAQDNFMWESIVILAKRIHNLEDNNYVK
ncbi:hypothetical protein AAA410_11570 [Lactobacillus crispatus]|uniref:hypothetical protein n=1 Tax=Lactobacillus crispatus TaxID=47770 RepID=UPI0030F618B6